MSYTVFARKYRPKTFADVLGQDHVVKTLCNAIAQDRLAQAYLFVGPRGTGKTSTARIFAKALNCTGGPKVDFDPEEDVCQEIAEGRSLDVLEIDGASNNSVDQVRELRDSVGFAPARGKFRIYYIDEVHMLTTAAFNALLKTLEEPPPHVKFIFATTEAHKILPTILSRCKRFDLRRIPSNVIADHLLHIAKLENVKLDRLAAHAIARGADGGMRDAQSMLDQLVAFCGSDIKEEDVMHIFGFTSHETVANLSDQIFRAKTADALAELHVQAESGKDLSKLLADLIFHFRNVLVHQVDPVVAMKELPPELRPLMEVQAKLISSERLMQLLDQFAEVEANMRWAPNKRLCFEIGIIKAAQALGETTLSDVIVAMNNALGNAPITGAPTRMEAAEAFFAPPQSAAKAPPQPPAPVPAAPPSPTGKLAGADLWAATLQELGRSHALLVTWAEQGVYCETKGHKFIIGFNPDDEFQCENLQRPDTKAALEEILLRLSGQKLEFAPEVRQAIERPELNDPGPPPDAPIGDADLAPPTAVGSAATGQGIPAAPHAQPEPDHDEELINKAMVDFEAKRLARSNA